MAKDPYKYFRVEARELVEGLTNSILQLERRAPAPGLIPEALRLAHTLKGAARVVKQPQIAELAHTLEGLLADHRESVGSISEEQGSEMLRVVDEIASYLNRLEPAAEGQAAEAKSAAVVEEPLETVRVEIQEMDELLRGLTEASIQLGAVRQQLAAGDRLSEELARLLGRLRRTRDDAGAAPDSVIDARALAEALRSSIDRFRQGLTADVDRVDTEVSQVRDIAHRLRLVPALRVFPSLARAVRDAAQSLGKAVEFETVGGEVRLEATVLASIRDALMHVVRNAVTHGVETAADRVRLGKAPTSTVRLTVERRGGHVGFVCADDGRGIDIEAVKRAAVARGQIPSREAESLGSDDVIALLGGGGLTTSSEITELAGRGVGLNVVRATATRLKGLVAIRSTPGRGAEVELRVPVSIASLQALVVETDGVRAAIPLDAVRHTFRIRDTDVTRSADRSAILHDGVKVPFMTLDRALGRSQSGPLGGRIWSAVIVQVGLRRGAIGVEKLVATSNVVMRPLPRSVEANGVVLGASLDGDGSPQLVLDPSGLIDTAESGSEVMSEESAPEQLPILVIDDSLTTRMLEQSILESAGYAVDLAVCAEDALIQAAKRRYCLFIVDVEMPGMDGFEFVARTRSDPALRHVPAILVTSRHAAEDRRRGEQVGARAYIVKGEFDQGKLLQTIRTLVA